MAFPGLPRSPAPIIPQCAHSPAHARLSEAARGRSQRSHREIEAALDTLSQDLVERGLAYGAGSESGLPSRAHRARPCQFSPSKNVTAQTDLERLKAAVRGIWRQTKDWFACSTWRRKAPGVRIFIGSENKLFPCRAHRWSWRPNRDKGLRASSGRLASLGPTRLNYARIVPMGRLLPAQLIRAASLK